MRLIRGINNFLVLFIVVAITLGTVANVILRYAFNSPLLAYEELAIFLFVWLVALGFPVCYRNKKLMCLEIFEIESMNKFFEIVSDIFMVLFALIFIYLGTVFSVQSAGKVTNILRIPYFYIDISIVVGSALTLIELVAKYIARKN